MKKNKVINNASWIIGCRIAQAVFALIINMLTVRYLGPSNYGIINYATSLVAFVTPIMNLGINNVMVNELITYPKEEGKILGTSIVLTFISAIGCICGLIGFVSLANAGEKETIIVCFLYSLLLISQSIDIIHYWFQAKLLSKYVSITTLLIYVIVCIYKVWLLVTEKKVYWFAISNALDYILIAIVLLFIYRYKNGQQLFFSSKVAKRILKQSYHYILPGIMGIVLAQSDRIMLKFMNGNEAVGLYSAAYSIAGLTSFIFSAIIDSMRPGILSQKYKNEQKFKHNLSKLFGIIICLSFIQSIFITIFAEVIILVMYGKYYYSAITSLRIIVWYTGFAYFGAVRNIWILAENKQRYLWIISLSGMLINIILNFITIPKFGINGAAFSTLITQIFSNVIMNHFIHSLKEANYLAYKGLNIKTFK